MTPPLLQWFAQVVTQTPNGVAAIDQDRSWTYAELWAAAGVVRDQLRGAGVQPGDRVGVALERTGRLLAAILGIWRAGGVYLPLDLSLPQGRLRVVREDARPAVVLTDESQAGGLVVAVEGLPDAEAADAPDDPDALAYIFYTSGSTGQPKGVPIRRGSLSRFVGWMIDLMRLEPGARVLGMVRISFDLSILDVVCAPASGATLVLAPRAALVDGDRLAQLAQQHEVTHVAATPTAYALLRAAGWTPGPGTTLVSSGEALTVPVARWALHGGARLLNAYGPTECTVFVTMGEVTSASPPLGVGRLLPAVDAEIVDATGQPVEPGQSGELLLGGPQLAPGYWQLPERTDQVFVDTPRGRRYRTGDRVSQRPDGSLDFHGRLDNQVKVRGHRLELGEIEALLCRVEGVSAAAAKVVDGERVVAWVVPERPGSPAALRRRALASLSQQLPPAAVPMALLLLDALPQLASGKLDRAALPLPDRLPRPLDAPPVPPATPTEATLCAVAAQTLGLVEVGATDDFFLLGGQSLAAVRFVGAARAALGRTLTVRDLYERRTMRALADSPGAPLDDPGPVAGEAAGSLHLTLGQAALAVQHDRDGSAAWHVGVEITLEGPLDLTVLRGAVQAVLARHPALGLRLERGERGTTLRHAPPDVDLTPHPPSSPVLDRALHTPFALAHALLRVRLARHSETHHALVLCAHHLIVDGVSLQVLADDLAAALAGALPPPPALTMSDVAVWEQRLLTGAAGRALRQAWRARLQPLPSQPLFPASATPRGRREPWSLDAATTQALRGVAATHDASLAMALTAALVAALVRQVGRPTLAVGFVADGRGPAETADLVGHLANTLPIVVSAQGGPDGSALLRRVRDATLDALAHAELPLVEILRAAGRSGVPTVEVAFALQPAPRTGVAAGPLTLHVRELDPGVEPFPVGVQLWETAHGGLQGWIGAQEGALPVDAQHRLGAALSAAVAELAAGALELVAQQAGPPLQPGPRPPATLAGSLARAARAGAMLQFLPAGAHPGSAPHGLSAADLRNTARDRAAALVAAGVRPGQPVLLQQRTVRGTLEALWACVLAGAVPAPLLPPRAWALDAPDRSRVVASWGALDQPLVLADPEDRASVEAHLPGVRVCTLDDLSSGPRGRLPRLSAQAPALHLLTSGSTGTPKVVTHTHRSLLAHSAAIAQHHGFTRRSRFFNWLPIDHVGSLMMGHFGPLWLGASQLHATPDQFARDPRIWLDAIHHHRVTYTWAPNFAFASLAKAAQEAPGGRWDLSSLRVCMNAGEAIVPQTARRFLAALAPHGFDPTCLSPAWGMSETCSEGTGVVDFHPSALVDGAPVALGPVLPGVEMRIVDDADGPCAPGQVGRLQVRGATLFSEYRGRGSSRTADGWFDTGDLGTLGPAGLTLVGRSKDVLIVRGQNLSLAGIEAAVEALDGILDGASCACAVRPEGAQTDALVVVLEMAPQPAVEAAVRRTLGQRGTPAHAVVFVPKGGIPRTSLGKRQRSQLAARWTAGELAPAPAVLARAWVPAERAPAQSLPDRVWVAHSTPALTRALSQAGIAEADPTPGGIAVVGPGPGAAAAVLAVAHTPALARVVLFASDDDPQAGAPLLGLGATLARENPGLAVDLVVVSGALGPAVSAALATAAPSGFRLRAWRDGTWQQAELQAASASGPGLSGGLALLLGGLGGVGVRVADWWLHQDGNAALLVGRRPRMQLSGATLRALERLEARGARYLSVDAADEQALDAAVAAEESRLGAGVSVVLHLAATVDFTMLRDLAPAALHAAITSKAATTRAGAEIARRRHAAWVGFGSVNAWFGGFSVGAYAAADGILEAAAHALRAEGLPAWHLAWTAWRGVGLSAHMPAGAGRALGFRDLGPDEAIQGLRQALSCPPGSYALGLDPEAEPVQRWGRPVDVPPPARRLASPAAQPARAPQDARAAVSAIWADLLERDAVPPDANFFELGGHSLLIPPLQARLEALAGRPVPVVELFRHPTVAAQASLVGTDPAEPEAPTLAMSPAPDPAPQQPAPSGAVAVVGLACRFPDAPDVETFWANLVAGHVSGRRFSPDELAEAGVAGADDPRFVPVRAVLDHPYAFDADHFGLSPRQAALTDPQHRVFLEVAWEALESAGLSPGADGPTIGLFAGCSADTYLQHLLRHAPEQVDALGNFLAVLGNDKDHLTTAAAYRLNLTGPAVTVQTACSTGLVAVHLAAQSLLQGDCAVALAGASSIQTPVVGGHRYAPGDIYAPDGRCRPFDVSGEGTFSGDGVGVVVLKRLEDALRDGDPVHAVLRGSAINNDGHRKVGYSAPSADGQAAVLRRALDRAQVDPSTIGFIEGHGTATRLGDPIEVQALQQVYTGAPGSVALGSVKGNVGHLNTAAGLAGLLKAILAVREGLVPPTAHFQRPNPALGLGAGPLFVNRVAASWPKPGVRRAAVSSFGAGGTNAHAILEAPPPREAPRAQPGHYALLLSASSAAAADQACARLADHLETNPGAPLQAVADTLARRRRALPHRRAVVVSSVAEAVDALRGAPLRGQAAARRPVFFFPAQGFQRPGVGAGLAASSPTFRSAVDRCAQILDPTLKVPLHDLLFPRSAEATTRAAALLTDQRHAGAATVALSWATAALWRERGVEPAAVLGHSTGAYVAAAVAGLCTLEDALALFAVRASAMAALPRGAVLQVLLGPDEVVPRLVPDTWLALVNAPRVSVVTGTPSGIARLAASLQAEGIHHKHVDVSVPAHSPLLRPVAAPLREAASRLPFTPPRVPMLSPVTGGPLSAQEATDPEHWVRHLLSPQRLDRALAALPSDAVVLELGPARSASAYVELAAPGAPVVASHPDNIVDQDDLATPLASLWTQGGAPASVAAPTQAQPAVVLPPTPFLRTEHRLSVTVRAGAAPQASPELASPAPPADSPPDRAPRPALPAPPVAPRTPAERLLLPLAEELLGFSGLGVEDEFLSLGADSLIALRLMARVEAETGQTLPPSALFGGLSVAAMAAHVTVAESPVPVPAAAPQSVPTAARPPAAPPPAGALPVLVPMRTTGSRPPLFFAHPAGGVVFPYFALARDLGDDQPFYALQAVGLDGVTPPDPSVEAMAARYLRAVKTVQRTGPYYLAGYSFGCYVTFEMARQLEAAGEQVAFVGLMDELVPLDGHRASLVHLVRLIFGRAGRSVLQHLQDYAWLRQARQEGVRGALAKAFEQTALAGILPPDSLEAALSQPSIRPMVELLELHVRLTFSYSPGPYGGDVVLFKSDWWYDKPWFHRGGDEGALGWDLLVAGRVHIRRASGDHMAMIRPPHTLVLARELAAAMAAADGATPRRTS